MPEPAASWFCYRYGVADGGNVASDPHGEFTGKNILYQSHDAGGDGAAVRPSGGGNRRGDRGGGAHSAARPGRSACGRNWTIRFWRVGTA